MYPGRIRDVSGIDLRYIRDVSGIYPGCILDVSGIYPREVSRMYPGCIRYGSECIRDRSEIYLGADGGNQ
jgi:hypothetical protein